MRECFLKFDNIKNVIQKLLFFLQKVEIFNKKVEAEEEIILRPGGRKWQHIKLPIFCPKLNSILKK